jgi:hypothetical protein
MMPLTCADRPTNLAVAEGFEPSDGGYPSHAFEACSLGRSDTPPCGSLPGASRFTEIAASQRTVGSSASATCRPSRLNALLNATNSKAFQLKADEPALTDAQLGAKFRT